jgi:hypothetical protein
MLKADGFDNAIMGICSRAGQEDVIAYDTTKCIEVLMAQGMEYLEAVEYFTFNVSAAWLGDDTPVFIDTDPDLLELMEVLDA